MSNLLKNRFVSNKLPSLGGLIILIAFFLALPHVMTSFQTDLLSKFMVFGLVALSYDLIWGCSGISSFGHAMFFGLGAYSFGLVMKHINVPGATYLAFLASILVPMLMAVILSGILHYGRVSGVFFAIVTLILAIAFENIASAWTPVTGGLNGLYGYPKPELGIPGVWEFGVTGLMITYYIIFISLTGFLILVWWIMKKQNFGKVISALAENEERMQHLGYDISFFKLIIFTIACGIAGYAGALYSLRVTITPTLLGLAMSIQILVFVAVGGRGSLWGAVLGALIVSILREFLSGFFLNIWLLLVGTFFILVVMLWPKGLAGFIMRIRQIISRKIIQPGSNKEG